MVTSPELSERSFLEAFQPKGDYAPVLSDEEVAKAFRVYQLLFSPSVLKYLAPELSQLEHDESQDLLLGHAIHIGLIEHPAVLEEIKNGQ